MKPLRQLKVYSPAAMYCWLLLGVLLTTVGVLAGSRHCGALGLAMLSVMVFQWWQLRDVEQFIRVSREHPPRCFERDELKIQLHVAHRGSRPLSLVAVSDRFAAGGGRRVRGLIAELFPQSACTLVYRQKCDFRRGLFVLGPVEMSLADGLGLFQRIVQFPTYTELLVCPTPLNATWLNVLGDGTLRHVGSELIRRTGRSEQFAGVRHFRDGDELRFVHWPTSARQANLYVKEFDRNTVTEVTVVVDMFETGLAGLGAQTSCEQRLRAAATLAASAIEKNHLVRMVAAQIPVTSTQLGGGQRHLQNIMQWLAMLSPRGHGKVEEILREHATRIRPGATLALVLSSTNLDLEDLQAIIHAMRLRRVKVLAAIIEDRSYYKLRADQVERFDRTLPLGTIVDALRGAGCSVYTLERGTDVLTAFREAAL